MKRLLSGSLFILVVTAGSILGWQAYQAIVHADTFIISGVDIRGVKRLSEGDLKDIVGVFTGQNIFRVDIDGAAGRARMNPWVKEVRIHRQLPNRITMVITERVPALILENSAGRSLMDDEGFVIERLGRDAASRWPLPVVAIKDDRTRPGEQVSADALPEALQLIQEIQARGGWQPSGVTVKANSPESISVVYANHEFKIGTGAYPEKLRRLAEVMADVKQRGMEIASVDLRPSRQVAVMVKPQGQGAGGKGQGRKKRS